MTTTSTPSTLRAASPADISLILALIGELAEYELLSHQVVATEELIHHALFGERKYAEVIIAEVENEPAGFALFFHNFSTFLGRPGIYLEDLFVRPVYRGGGVGRMLLEHLAKIAVERNCGRLEWAVIDWNEPAIGFYKKLGAVPIDDWTIFRLTGDALLELGGGGRNNG